MADSNMEKESDRRFRSVWQPRLTIGLSILALLISVFTALGNEFGSFYNFLVKVAPYDQSIVNVLNVVVSIAALVYIPRRIPTAYYIQSFPKFKSLAELPFGDQELKVYIENMEKRVEETVDQYKLHITLFAFSLVLTYAVILLTGDDKRRVIDFFPIATNLLNLSGAVFVLLGFSVLNYTTLKESELPAGVTGAPEAQSRIKHLLYASRFYWLPAFLFVFLYACIFVAVSMRFQYVHWFDHIIFLNIFDLIAGLANGLAMTLLFGRYATIELSLRNTNLFARAFGRIFRPYKVVVTFGIVFLLPVYALAQPLFGSLEIEAFGNARRFQTIVFTVCLIGKICFFHLTYLLIRNNLLHLYLYGLFSGVGNFKQLEACFGTQSKKGKQLKLPLSDPVNASTPTGLDAP